MDYYHNLVTEKSRKELQKLRRQLDFVLIGGWAVFLYSKTLKSKDIDILVDYDKLQGLAKLYDLNKNPRLKKYEAVKEEVQIDVYLPHYSKIGIPVEDLLVSTINVEGFRVVEINYLVVLKLYSFNLRGNSTKGRKDFIDLVSLLSLPSCDYNKIKDIVLKYSLKEALDRFIQHLKNTFELKELRLNKHAFSRRKKEILAGSI